MLHLDHTAAVAAIVVVGSVGTIAQSPPAPSSPLTPGAVALLANSTDGAAFARVQEALSHADATVRAVAARVLGNLRVRGAALNLRSALEREGDEAAAAEMVRALLYLGDPESVGAVEARLPAAPWVAVQSYLEWLIMARPDDGGGRLERLFKARPTAEFEHSSELVIRAVTRTTNGRERALRGLLGTTASAAWRAVLDELGPDIAPAEAAVLEQALASGTDAVRRMTVWALVARLAKRERIPAGVLDAALQVEMPVATFPNGSAGWEQFGRELLARSHRQLRTPDRSNVIRAEGPGYRMDARLVLQLNESLPAEREAATEMLGEGNIANEPAKSPSDPEPPAASTPPRGQVTMRTVRFPWPALLPDLFKVTRCRVTDTVRVGIFEIAYRPDGRPRAVTVIPSELPSECRPAVDAIARLTIADPLLPIVEGEQQYVVVLMSSDHLTCVAARPPTAHIEGERVAPGRIKPPTKTRDVRPHYPPSAQQARVQGTVIVEATLSTTGCVANLEVLRSVQPVLDIEALRAVSQWRFTPTLLDGLAVPVILTVTVTFSLQ